MRRNIFTVVLLSLLAAGCHGPGAGGGFYQSPYRANGVDGPGPGVMGQMSHIGATPHVNAVSPMGVPMGAAPTHMPPGAIPMGAMPPQAGMMPSGQFQPMSLSAPNQMQMPAPRIHTSQINFLGVESLVIRYDAQKAGAFDSTPLICPATHDFGQGWTYRLKLSNIPGHPGKELFPTLEVAHTAARTQAFLSHSSIPIEFTDNDFDQVFSGNFVTKVVYLPNPEFQGIAMSGVGTLVNTQLQPGVDPIVEASKRGAILAVIRMGNKDLANRPEQPQWSGVPGTGAPGPMASGGMPPMGSSIPQNPIAGVNIPPYGVPMTKTTTGVPGPPQLPMDVYYGPNRNPIVRTEPIPAPPGQRTFAMPGQAIPNPYVPPM